jgi:hypothetical protein
MRTLRLRLVSIACLTASMSVTTLVGPSGAAWIRGGLPICIDPHVQRLTSIASDGAGGAILVWTDQRFGNEDVYAQRVDSTGTVLWSADGVAVVTGDNKQDYAAAVRDGAGAIVFWASRRLDLLFDIDAQRLDGAGVPQWGFGGISMSTLGAVPSLDLLAISDNSSGITQPPGSIVLWVGGDGSENQTLQLQHVDRAGGNLWAPPFSGGVRLTCASRPAPSCASPESLC